MTQEIKVRGSIPPTPFGIFVSALAISSSNRAFISLGAFFGGGIQEINLATAAREGPIFGESLVFQSLEYVGDLVYGVAFPGGGISSLYQFNPATGSLNNLGETGIGPIRGLAYDFITSTMYALGAETKQSEEKLYTLNLLDGSTTELFSLGTNQLRSLAFGSEGFLYSSEVVLSPDIPNLYRINQNTGTITNLGPLAGLPSKAKLGISGLSLGPVL